MAGTIMPSESDLITQATRLLADRLGPGWRVRVPSSSWQALAGDGLDAAISIDAPDGTEAVQLVEAKQRVFPRDVRNWLTAVRPSSSGDRYLLVARYLGPRARDLLDKAGVNYIDLTGNMLVRIDTPSLFIRERGSDKDPAPVGGPARSLLGAKAARVVRTLCDFKGAITSRSVAVAAGVTPSYVSKIVALLEREALVERQGRGPVQPITRVLWADLIRRWSDDYRLLDTNAPRLFLAPRGLPDFLRDLTAWAGETPDGRYALTGSFAAAKRAPVAPPSLLFCYVDAPSAVAEQTGLVRASGSGNVYLCEPFDPVVYERTWSDDGMTYAALAQVAADCLGGPDRMPAEGDALLEWMAANEQAWRLDA